MGFWKLVYRQNKRMHKPGLCCVIDSLGWVQEARIKYLSKHLKEYRLAILTADQFGALWNKGKLPHESVYFASWRIPFTLISSQRCQFKEFDYLRFMASITSHYNIGGGLDPAKALPSGTNSQESFDSAIRLIRQFKVVTANSRILHHLLSPHLDHIIYAPNGVDTSFFSLEENRHYDPHHIKVGWVGKIKAAKNYEVVEKAFRRLGKEGFRFETVALAKNVRKGKLLSKSQMKRFYHKIDYYLCTSWHEGTPNPALEAASCGVPIVTTRVGNMPELIEHGENGFFVDPTVESIVERFMQIKRLTPVKYGRLSSNIRDSILRDWTWEKNASNYRTAFEGLLKTRAEL